MYLITRRQIKTIMPLKQLSYLLKQKMPVSSAFKIVIKDIELPEIKHVFIDIAVSVEQGTSLEDAFAKHPRYFPQFMINLLYLGAKTSKVSQTLNHYTLYLENRLSFAKNIQTALFYPAILFAVFIVSIFFLLNFVFPQIISLFSENLTNLPLISRITISTLMFLEQYFLLILFAFIFLSAVSIKLLLHFGVLDKLVLKIPLIKTVIIKSEIILWLTSVQTALKSGSMFFDAFKYATKAIANSCLKTVFADMIKAKEGGVLASKWEEDLLLPEFFKANIENILDNESFSEELIDDMHAFYQKDVSGKIAVLLKTIEPLLIIVLGIIIGIVSISVLLPILDSSKAAAF